MITGSIPDQYKPKLEVVSCYVEHDGEILLLQRHEEHKYSSKWGLPAGKLEKGESKEQATKREIKEETGLVINENDLIYREVLFVSHEGKDFLYYVFNAHFKEKPEIKINPPEHKQYAWFPINEALQLDLIHDLDACIERHYEIKKANIKSS